VFITAVTLQRCIFTLLLSVSHSHKADREFFGSKIPANMFPFPRMYCWFCLYIHGNPAVIPRESNGIPKECTMYSVAENV